MKKQAELYRGKAKTVYSTKTRICWYLNSVTIRQQGMAPIEQFDRKGMVNNKFNHFIMSSWKKPVSRPKWKRCFLDTECPGEKADMVRLNA